LRCDVVPGSPRLIVSTPSAIPGAAEHDDEGTLLVREVAHHPRRPGRYRVTLDGGRLFLLSAAGVSQVGATHPGVRLAPPQVRLLEREAAITEVFDRAVASLARQRRSRRQLELSARRRGADPALIAEAMDRLESAGMLDDRSLAEAEASARVRRGEAPSRVRQQLRRKGVAAELVDPAVQQAVVEEGFDEPRTCEQLARKRWPALSAYPPDVRRRRLAGFLLRRGFSGAVVQGVVRRLEREGEHPRDA
jgi:regulatory protein